MQSRTFPIFLFLCVAAIGCYATIAQVILTREFLNIFYGNELCLGIVFGAWFLGIATGAFAGAKVEHTFQHAFSVFIITLFVLCFVLPLQIFSVRGVRGLLSVGIGEYISLLPLLLTSIGLIFPFSFIIGFVFPLSSKVVWDTTTTRRSRNHIQNRELGAGIGDQTSGIRNPPQDPLSLIPLHAFAKNNSSLPSNTQDAAVDIGYIYIIESIGSLVGGLAFSFFQISRFHPFLFITQLNIGMFVLLASLLFTYCRKEHIGLAGEKNKKISKVLFFFSAGLAWAMIGILISPLPDKIESLSTSIRWNTLNPHIELVASADSKYQHIDIGKQADQYSIYLNGQYAAAFPNEYEYAQVTHLVMTQHPSPKHLLLIGNGLGGIISEMLLYPIETLDYVELDQGLLQISGRYLSPSDKQALSDRRVTVFHQDGRYYVKNRSKKQHYDIILVNTPDPATAFLNRFYTLEFFQEAQAILQSDGVLAASVSSAVTYIGKEVGSYTGSLYRTLHEAFSYVLVTPGQTNFYFACNKEGVITTDIEILTERYRKLQVKSDYFTEHLFYTLLPPEQVAFIGRQLGQRKDLLVNTDERPVTYFFNLVLWDSLTGGRLHGLFHRLKDMGIQSFLIPIAIAVAGRIIYVILRQRNAFNRYYPKQLKTSGLIAIATTGFTGIALEIVLLFAFQNIYGYIYERMGVVVAVFMVGLALGGYLMNQIIKKTRNPKSEFPNNSLLPTVADSYQGIKILLLIQGIIGCYALILPFFIHKLSFYSAVAEVGLISLIGIAGILTGIEFPLVNKICIQHTPDVAVSAGATNGADHIGAFFGAIVTGVIFIPLLGVSGTCLVLASLNIASLILITFSILYRKRSKDLLSHFSCKMDHKNGNVGRRNT